MLPRVFDKLFRHRTLTTSLLVLAAFSGCNKGDVRPEYVPVKGTLTLGGKPLASATVSFLGPKAPQPGVGVTNEKGEFELSTVAGENTVMVQLASEGATAVMDASKMAGGGDGNPLTAQAAAKTKVKLPEGVGTVNSHLKVTVGPTGNPNAKVEL